LLNPANDFSIGLKSGEYGGRYSIRTPEDRKPGLVEALIQFLSAAAGVISEHNEVTKALEGVDINDTDAGRRHRGP